MRRPLSEKKANGCCCRCVQKQLTPVSPQDGLTLRRVTTFTRDQVACRCHPKTVPPLIVHFWVSSQLSSAFLSTPYLAMSSDDYFHGDDDFDASALQQLDAIEAAHFSPRKTAPTRDRSTSPIPPPQLKPNISTDSSFNDISFDVDEAELEKLDTFIQDSYAGKAQPVAGPSKLSRTSSNNTRQLTLYGDVLPPTTQSNNSKAPQRSQMERTKSVQRLPFGQQAPKTKIWDQTAFAKSGARKSKQKGKGKSKAGNGHDSEEEENIEFEQFPAPFVPSELAILIRSAR